MTEPSNLTMAELTNLTITEGKLLQELRPDVYYARTYAYIIWYCIGIPANIIACLVWLQRKMVNSSGCYLVALAVTDTVFLLIHIPVAISAMEVVDTVNHPVLCQMIPVVYMGAQYMSSLLVLVFTVEQYIAICHPFKKTHYCRVSVARKTIAGVLAAVLALSLMQAYFFLLTDDRGCTVRDSALVGGTSSFWSVWTWSTQMILFGAVPICCLCLNLMVIYQVLKPPEKGLTRHYSSSQMKQSKEKTTTTLMLLMVSLYYVFTELPATITLGLQQLYNIPADITDIKQAGIEERVKPILAYLTARTVVEFICFSRYSCKLFIYLVTGKQFRNHLKRLCRTDGSTGENKTIVTDTRMTDSKWTDSSQSDSKEATKLITTANADVAEKDKNNKKKKVQLELMCTSLD